MAETIVYDFFKPEEITDGSQKFISLKGLDHFWTKAQGYVDAQDLLLGNRITGVAEDLAELQEIVNGMNGTSGSGTIADRIQAAIDALNLDETYETKADATAKLTEAKRYTDTEVAAMATTLRSEMDGDLTEAKSYADGEISKAVGAYAVEGETPVAASGLRGEIAQRDTGVLAAAKEHANGLDAAMNARVVKLEAIDHDKLAADAASSAVASVVGGAPQAFDTLKEIADWIQKDATNENGFDAAARIVALEEADAAIRREFAAADTDVLNAAKSHAETKAGEAQTAAINAANAALNSYTKTDDMNKAITEAENRAKTAAQEAITALTQTVTNNLADAKKYADDQDAARKAEIMGVIEENERVTSEALNDLDGRVTTNADAIDALTQTVANNLAEAKSHADSKAVEEAGKAQTTAEAFAKTYTDALFASITFATDAEIGGIFE